MLSPVRSIKAEGSAPLDGADSSRGRGSLEASGSDSRPRAVSMDAPFDVEQTAAAPGLPTRRKGLDVPSPAELLMRTVRSQIKKQMVVSGEAENCNTGSISASECLSS